MNDPTGFPAGHSFYKVSLPLNMEMVDLERLVKKYQFKDALLLVEALQTKLKG